MYIFIAFNTESALNLISFPCNQPSARSEMKPSNWKTKDVVMWCLVSATVLLDTSVHASVGSGNHCLTCFAF
jgi:hypothetical protein